MKKKLLILAVLAALAMYAWSMLQRAETGMPVEEYNEAQTEDGDAGEPQVFTHDEVAPDDSYSSDEEGDTEVDESNKRINPLRDDIQGK